MRKNNGEPMKIREIFLDFTSLLDVTLIVIFFFVIFSHLDGEENRAKTEAKVSEMEVAIDAAEDREALALELGVQLENDLQIVRDVDERQAETAEGLMEYAKNGNVKMILAMQEEGWKLRLNHKEESVAEILFDADIGAELGNTLQKLGYDEKDTIFCDFVFDGSLPGTASAYRKITRGLDTVMEQYRYLYYSETDLSIGEE